MSASMPGADEWLRLAKAARYCVKRYAAMRGLSPRQLRRLFLQECGRSPRDALADARLARAEELLLARRPVKAVADEVCFKHASNFIAWFEQAEGCTPTEFAAARLSRILPPASRRAPVDSPAPLSALMLSSPSPDC